MYGDGSKTTYTPDGILSGETIKPYTESWIQSGDQIWLDEYSSVSFKNPLQPEEWPISSAGEQMHFGSSTTYVTDAKQLFDLKKRFLRTNFFLDSHKLMGALVTYG